MDSNGHNGIKGLRVLLSGPAADGVATMLQHQPAISLVRPTGLAETQPFFGYRFDGRIFDCGSKIGFLTANIAYALARSDVAPALRSELKRLLND